MALQKDAHASHMKIPSSRYFYVDAVPETRDPFDMTIWKMRSCNRALSRDRVYGESLVFITEILTNDDEINRDFLRRFQMEIS